jgi:hypothetical protein
MNSTGVLRVRAVPTTELSDAAVAAMWQLYADFYDHVTYEAFRHDLAEKTLVFIGTDSGSDELAGFSTALFYRHRFRGRRVGIYFSGDTIFRPRYWGQTAFHRAVTKQLLKWKIARPFEPLYWHLICSGFRTYLSLVRNFPTHWPHHARACPWWERGLIDSICTARYGRAWKAARGVVSFGPEQPVLKSAVAPITPDVLALPEVAFFVKANPGYQTGDELAMIAQVDFSAMLGMAAKWARKALRRRTEISAPLTARV